MSTHAHPTPFRLPSPAELASSSPPDAPVRTLVDEFLALQATTTAVERFAAADPSDHAGPAQARWYRDLLPATPPGPGQQYAFAVDLDACSGCKACVAACHSLNGLDEGVAFRDVGLLAGTGERALVQPVTTGCHHCAEPGCLAGCPVDAYEVTPEGVVEHLDDQCIGCRYCTLTCPYEVPSYDASRGIVRKCDLCHDRLAVGEAPACVQACPTEAISITVVDVDDVVAAGADGEAFPFDAPDARATRPSTRFSSSRDLRTDVVGVDRHTAAPREAHPPLVAMLVLTQLAVGTLLALEVARRLDALDGLSPTTVAGAALVTTVVGLLTSLAHLGRPHLAWRAVIGLRHSWLSREIVAFGAFAPLGALHALALADVGLAVWRPSPDLTGLLVCLAGVVAVATSVMVYVATGRDGWGPVRVAVRFALTTVGLGVAALGALAAALGAGALAGQVLPAAAALAVVAALVDLGAVRGPRRAAPRDPGAVRRHEASARTARLLRGPLAGLARLRFCAAAAVVAVGLIGAAIADDPVAAGPLAVFAGVGLLAAMTAEGVARWWFFTAEGSPRMPRALR